MAAGGAGAARPAGRPASEDCPALPPLLHAPGARRGRLDALAADPCRLLPALTEGLWPLLIQRVQLLLGSGSLQQQALTFSRALQANGEQNQAPAPHLLHCAGRRCSLLLRCLQSGTQPGEAPASQAHSRAMAARRPALPKLTMASFAVQKPRLKRPKHALLAPKRLSGAWLPGRCRPPAKAPKAERRDAKGTPAVLLGRGWAQWVPARPGGGGVSPSCCFAACSTTPHPGAARLHQPGGEGE